MSELDDQRVIGRDRPTETPEVEHQTWVGWSLRPQSLRRQLTAALRCALTVDQLSQKVHNYVAGSQKVVVIRKTRYVLAHKKLSHTGKLELYLTRCYMRVLYVHHRLYKNHYISLWCPHAACSGYYSLRQIVYVVWTRRWRLKIALN